MATYNTDQGRMSALLRQSSDCRAAEALQRARALRGACRPRPTASEGTLVKPTVPVESAYLAGQMGACLNRFQGPEGCVPASVNTARLQQRTLDLSSNPYTPRPVIPFVCVDPPWYANAGEPVLQGKVCPLPNKPDNPVLPG